MKIKHIFISQQLIRHITYRSALYALGLVCAFWLLVTPMGCHKRDAQTNEVQAPTAADSVRRLVMTVRSSARLYVTEMQVHKLVTNTDEPVLTGQVLGMPVNMPTRIGKRRVLIPLDVTIKAYIDLQHFDERNVERTDSTLIMTLPDPQVVITASKIDNKGIRQYVDMARSRYTDAEITALARQGEDSIARHMAHYGIEREAQRSAANQLLPLLQQMGYKEGQITVRFKKTFTDNDFVRMTRRQ